MTKIVRVDTEFAKRLREIMGERAVKKLSLPTSKDMGTAEATRLILRSNSWQSVERDLRNLPKRKT